MILTKKNILSVDLDDLINKKTREKKLNELLRIVPTNRKIRSLKREIISETPGRAIDKLNLETIGTFSTRILLTNYQTRVRVLSEAASATLMKQSFQETELKYFSDYGEDIPLGTLERIKNVISEYKKHGITPELLRKEAENLTSSEKIKALDIAGIFEVYLKKCNSLNVKEIGDIYFSVNQQSQNEFESKFRSLFPEVNLIVISGFDEFTEPEIEIIERLSNISNADLFVSFDYYAYNPLLFSHLDKCYARLSEKGFREIKEKSVSNSEKFSALIRENLLKEIKRKRRGMKGN